MWGFKDEIYYSSLFFLSTLSIGAVAVPVELYQASLLEKYFCGPGTMRLFSPWAWRLSCNLLNQTLARFQSVSMGS